MRIDGEILSHGNWNDTLKTILAGTRGQTGSLPSLRAYESFLVQEIMGYLTCGPYAKHLRFSVPADLLGKAAGFGYPMLFVKGRGSFQKGTSRLLDQHSTYDNSYEKGKVAFAKIRDVSDLFPDPAGIQVNMMPFVLGERSSLPDYLQPYYPLIDACPFYKEEFGNVAYLTVHESFEVKEQSTQRRPGLHIESPGVFSDQEPSACFFTPGEEHPWGAGVFLGPDQYDGGIYLASNVGDTTAVWDALVDRITPGVVKEHGDCEHLRSLLNHGPTLLKAGELIWMTDCTLHECLPQPNTGPRTFFRLVMPNVSHWYAAHSTPNPKVAIPDNVTVIQGSKFSERKRASLRCESVDASAPVKKEKPLSD